MSQLVEGRSTINYPVVELMIAFIYDSQKIWFMNGELSACSLFQQIWRKVISIMAWIYYVKECQVNTKHLQQAWPTHWSTRGGGTSCNPWQIFEIFFLNTIKCSRTLLSIIWIPPPWIFSYCASCCKLTNINLKQ